MGKRIGLGLLFFVLVSGMVTPASGEAVVVGPEDRAVRIDDNSLIRGSAQEMAQSLRSGSGPASHEADWPPSEADPVNESGAESPDGGHHDQTRTDSWAVPSAIAWIFDDAGYDRGPVDGSERMDHGSRMGMTSADELNSTDGGAEPESDGSNPIEIRETTPAWDWIRQGYTASVRATVYNAGTERARRTLTLTVGERVAAVRSVRLDPDERAVVTFEFDAQSGLVAIDGVPAGKITVGRDWRTASAPGTDTESIDPESELVELGRMLGESFAIEEDEPADT